MHREKQDRRRRLVLITGVGMTLWLGAGVAHSQSCDPLTTPCQTCPPMGTCTPTGMPCESVLGGGSGGQNTTMTISTQTCTGSFAQETTTLEDTIGPGTICVGPDRSISCEVLAGTTNLNVHVDTIVAGSVVAIPTLSLWALGALAVALGALALRRLAAPPG